MVRQASDGMTMAERLGSQPIQSELQEKMNELAHALDSYLNGDARGGDRTWGFILMAFPFGSDLGRCNYISNAERQDVITLLREQLRYFEGMAEPPEPDHTRPQ